MLGGIRSGKSQWAETAIAEFVPTTAPVRYLATGPPPAATPTGRRASPHTARAGRRTGRRSKLSTWQRNCASDAATRDAGRRRRRLADRGDGPRRRVDGGSVAADVDRPDRRGRRVPSPLALVSPEVGLTVVPATAAGRRFADELGSLNQRLAAAVRPGGAGGRRAAVTVKGTSRDGFPPVTDFDVTPPDADVAAAARARQDTADQTARLAGPARGPVGVGGGVPGRVPAAPVRAGTRRGVRRRPRRHLGGGVRVSGGGHRADGRQLRRGRRGHQRARRGGRRKRAGGRHRRGRRRAAVAVDRRAQGPSRQRQHRRRGRVERRGEVAAAIDGGPPDRRRGGRLRRGPADRRRHGHRKHHGRNDFDRRADQLRARGRGRPGHRRRRRGLGAQDRRDPGRALPGPRGCPADPVGAAAGLRRRRPRRDGGILRPGRRAPHAGAARRRGGDRGRVGGRATRAGRPAVVAGGTPVHRTGHMPLR